MARSSKTQRPAKKRKRPVEPKSFNISDVGTIQIRGEVLQKFKTDDRFIAMVRVARLTNALNDSLARMIQSVDHPPQTPAEWRGRWRAFFNGGGYIYEGFMLVESLRDDHGNRSYFREFRDVLNHRDYERQKAITRVIRNSAAFHLDHHDRSTRKGLEGMTATEPHDFVSGAGDSLGALYFNIADIVDINLLVDEFKDGRPMSDLEVIEEITVIVIGLLGSLGMAADAFARGMALRMGLVSNHSP